MPRADNKSVLPVVVRVCATSVLVAECESGKTVTMRKNKNRYEDCKSPIGPNKELNIVWPSLAILYQEISQKSLN